MKLALSSPRYPMRYEIDASPSIPPVSSCVTSACVSFGCPAATSYGCSSQLIILNPPFNCVIDRPSLLVPPAMKKPIRRLLLRTAEQPHHHPVLAHAAEILARVRAAPLSTRHAIGPRRFDDVVPL